MGVKIRKRGGKWYVFVNYHGRRKAKCVGASRQLAEQVRRQVEAKLTLGDIGFLAEEHPQIPSLTDYADRWIRQYAELNCKPSTVYGYKQVLNERIKPVLGTLPLNRITRDRMKEFLADLSSSGLSRNTLRNTICVIRGMFNHALEDGLVDNNPAAKLGRFVKSDKPKFEAMALAPDEAEKFLKATQEICLDYYPLFLTALRGGLRRGELVALQWGDIQFGADESDSNRYILVQRNYVCRKFTTPKSKKSRRVDLSRQLRHVLMALRDERLLAVFSRGDSSISGELVFPSPEGSVLDPDNLIKRYFLPAIENSGLRRFRFHDLRHTFGSLLIQSGASLTYVKEQMGHSSIQVTVDTYGHLIPGANVNWVDSLDANTTPQQSATRAQLPTRDEAADVMQVIEEIGGGGWTRTNDLGIMRPSL